MKAIIYGSYTKKPADGTVGPDKTVFMYELEGTKEELAQYKEDREKDGNKFTLSDNGKPLYFTTKAFGQTGRIKRTINGHWLADTTNLLIAKSMAEQFGSSSEFSKALSDGLIKEALANAPKPETLPETEKSGQGLGEL